MNKKGFTLVELLAIITILGLIGLITLPITGSIIRDSEKKTFNETLNSIIESAKIYNIESNYKAISDEGIDIKSSKLKYTNKETIISGKLYYENNDYYLEEVKTKNFCANGSKEKFNIYVGECK